MKVQELMTRNPATCTPDTDLQKVAQMMVECDCGAIPVVQSSDGSKPVGIVTDRDIVTRIIAKGQNPLQMRAKDAMTESTVTISSDQDVQEAVRLMEQKQIRRLIVTDGGSKITGIVAQADLARQDRDQRTGELVEQVSKPSGKASQPAGA